MYLFTVTDASSAVYPSVIDQNIDAPRPAQYCVSRSKIGRVAPRVGPNRAGSAVILRGGSTTVQAAPQRYERDYLRRTSLFLPAAPNAGQTLSPPTPVCFFKVFAIYDR